MKVSTLFAGHGCKVQDYRPVRDTTPTRVMVMRPIIHNGERVDAGSILTMDRTDALNLVNGTTAAKLK